MSLMGAMKISTEAMGAQALRLNMVASNLANADVSANSFESAYKAKKPLFETVSRADGSATVRVSEVQTSANPAKTHYDPSDPMADERGMVWKPNVDVAAEMADMISSSRAYELNADVANMSRALVQKAFAIGQ